VTLTKRVTELEKKVDQGFAGVDQRFESLENKMDAQFARIDKKFDDFLIRILQHFPTRQEVKQMIGDAVAPLATKVDVNELKDHVAELRDDLEVRDAFTQHRLRRVESHLGFEPIELPI
jgi:hypothetical protein